MKRPTHHRTIVVFILLTTLVACANAAKKKGSTDGGGDDGADDAGSDGEARVYGPLSVDLLLMIDNSGSMKEEQAKLQEQIPELTRRLAESSSDGGAGGAVITDLRVGVVTTDLGTGEFATPKCTSTGDDGLLITRTGDVAGFPPTGCGENGYGSGQKFVVYDPAGDSDAFASQVGCVAVAGTEGCGFEQQLESPLKALTPDGSALRFANETKGHGDDNGFVREGSLLVIMLLTDEEDCSASDYDIFNMDSTAYPLPEDDLAYHNVHCYTDEALDHGLHPVSRYIDGLLALRADRPELLFFGAIAGVPLAYDPANESYDELLGESSMAYGFVKEPPLTIYELAAVCSAGDAGRAAPARRIVEVAKGLDAHGAGTFIHSVCDEDYGSMVDAVVAHVAKIQGN